MSSSSSAAAAAAAVAAPAPLPPQLEALLASADSSLDAVEAALDPYLAGPLKHLVTALQPIDNARLNTSLAFCSAGLLYCECGQRVQPREGVPRGGKKACS